MAVFYNKEKSKLGTLTGSIISFSTKLETNEPTDTNNRRLLPSGYIRCDGSVYSANVYPLLAEVLGTGASCKFKKSTTTLRSDQFQVPDLLVKHIRASTRANVGDLNDLYYETATGTTLTKSGIGLDVLSNVDSVYTLSYTGSFYLPSITVPLRGEPSFSRTTGDYTEDSEIPYNSIIPHAHFSTTARSRTKNYGGLNTANTQNNYNQKTSTLDVCAWYKNTKQDLCQASAETLGGFTSATITSFFNTSNSWKWINMCLSTCKFNTTAGGSSCLIPITSVGCEPCVTNFEFPVQKTINAGSQGELKRSICGGPIEYISTGYLKCQQDRFFGGVVKACSFLPPSETNSETLRQVPGSYTLKTVPFAPGSNAAIDVGFMGLSNITTTTSSVGNDAIHKHRVPLDAQPHTYQIQTQSQIFSAEGLTSTISINTTAEKKADNYIQPYVIVEYLIKV
jgi:hypothetical protein